MTYSLSPAPPLSEVHHLLGHPNDLRGHIETHGPLNMALDRNSPWQDALLANLEASGLAGRGGSAFPTAIKLALARSHGRGGTIVVNGMEGEPASDKDKLLLTRGVHPSGA
jgi:NADH:ubiquinone oxidoreductase subunit F (NADH-binding)